MNPNFDPNSNPFEAIMSQLKGIPSAPAQPMAQTPQSPATQPDPEDPTQPGSNPGGSQFLIKAMQNMHQFIGSSTDPIDIAAVRGVITIITRLISRDQEQQGQKTPMPQQSTTPTTASGPGRVQAATGQAGQQSYSGPTGPYGV